MGIYLDNNATTPVDPEIVEAIEEILVNQFGNAASTTHSFGWYAAELVEIAREGVAAALSAQPEEIIFTSGATESNNTAIKGFALANAKSSIITCATEHSSILDCQDFLEQLGSRMEILDLDRTGGLNLSELEQQLKSNSSPKLVSIMTANNEIGALHDVAKISEIASQHGAKLHTDATQALGKIQLDVEQLGADYLSISAHKAYGPKGVGALYIRGGKNNVGIRPLISGGGHEYGFRSGTLNVPGIVGLGVACELAQQRLVADQAELKRLAKLFLEKLEQGLKPLGKSLQLIGPDLDFRLPGNLNLRIVGVSASVLIPKIQGKLAISASSACQSNSGRSSHVLRAIGLSESESAECIRVGIGRFNSEDQILRAVEILLDATK